MANAPYDIHDYEIQKLIGRLILFLGQNQVKSCLRRYYSSLKSSGPIFREYYLKTRHPWWDAFSKYFAFEKSGMVIRKHLTPELLLLAGDAKKIAVLEKCMPDSVKQKYKRDLVDEKRAYDYLFEIQMAWHFFLKGCTIQWHEDNSGRHSEFLVQSEGCKFNVECKRVSIDASRKIHRQDFYRLADMIIPGIQKLGYSGSIDISISDRLHATEEFIRELSNQVIGQISSGTLKGNCHIPFGSLSINLEGANGTVIDLQDRWERLCMRKDHNGHCAIFAQAKEEKPIDPIDVTLKSEKADNVLKGIKERIANAKDQLVRSMPGLIICFLEGMTDFREFASKSGLQRMTSELLCKDEYTHVVGVSYYSEPLSYVDANTEEFFHQGLLFRNSQCRFEEAKRFQFMAPLEAKFQSAT